MKCVICKHGTTKPGESTLTFDRDGKTYVIRHVPADVCKTCGEAYFSSEVASQLEKSLDQHTVPDVPADTRSYVPISQPNAF